jgi:hypothetical protein
MWNGNAKSQSNIGDQVGPARCASAERVEREKIVAVGELKPLERGGDRRLRLHVIAILEA